MQLSGSKRQLEGSMDYQQMTFLGSLPPPPMSLDGVALLSHNPPQPVQFGPSPAEPAPPPPQPRPPIVSPLDTAEVMHCVAPCRRHVDM
jgi:hypothetical protein